MNLDSIRFTGQTVAIVGAHPGLTDAQLAAVKGLPTIAANRGILRVPDADMLVSIDANWPAEAADYTGLRIVGVEFDNAAELGAIYINLPHERVNIAQGHQIEIRNNALMAMRLAVMGGATKLILLGIDGASYDSLPHDFTGLTQGLAQLTAELAGQGVQVELIQPETVVTTDTNPVPPGTGRVTKKK